MTASGEHLSLAATFFLATALAMDAFAVSLSGGLYTRKESFSRIIRMPLAFGFFQAGMLVAGWSAVKGVQEIMSAIDHWIAFTLLLGVGAHMILGGIKGGEREARDLLDLRILFVLAVATSIDAFAVGMSLSLVQLPLLGPAVITGVVRLLRYTLETVLVRCLGKVLK
jgi:putative Mn2+ efflux pump MntP